MIEPNKYTDETIHVANWLLATGEGIELLELARHDATKKVESLDEPDRCEFDERVRHYLVDRIDGRFMDALGECFPNHWYGSTEEIGGVCHGEYYPDASAEDLILPFVSQAVERLSLENVADIIFDEYTISIPAAGIGRQPAAA